MNLAVAFANSVRSRPAKIALIWGEREFSYAELWAQSLKLASELQVKFGVKPGERVGLWLKNCPEFVPALFAILQADAVVVPINNFLKPDEVNFIIGDAGIKVLVTDTELGAHFPALAAAHPELKLFKIDSFAPGGANGYAKPTEHANDTRFKTPATTTESDLAVLIYTSGTTGRPKGAMLSHGNLLHNVESCRIVLQTVEADRFAVLLPLFHS